PPLVAGLVTLSAAVIMLACLRTEYYPVLRARMKFDEAIAWRRQGRHSNAESAATAAAAADPLDPQPCSLAAELRLSRWLTSDKEDDWQSFLAAANRFRELDSQHHAAWISRGA